MENQDLCPCNGYIIIQIICLFSHLQGSSFLALNPAMKFDWIEKNSTKEEYIEKQQWVMDLVSHLQHYNLLYYDPSDYLQMLKYQQMHRKASAKLPTLSTPHKSMSRSYSTTSVVSSNLSLGFSRLQGLDSTVQRSQSLSIMTVIPKASPAAEMPAA